MTLLDKWETFILMRELSKHGFTKPFRAMFTFPAKGSRRVMTWIKRLRCRLFGHRYFTIWTAGGGDVWGDGCYSCGMEEVSPFYRYNLHDHRLTV